LLCPFLFANFFQQKLAKDEFEVRVKVLQDRNLIEDNYKIIWNGSFCDTKQLTTNNISEGFIIYEKLSI